MKLLIELPDREGDGGIDVIWHKGSYVKIASCDHTVVISANESGLKSLGEQMIYLSQSNIINGAHVHLDDFFCDSSLDGLSLTIEKSNT